MARPRAHLADQVPWIADSGSPPTRDAASRPLLRLQTLGTAVILCGEVRIGPSAGILFALLLRLTHAPGLRVSRDTLLQLLWTTQEPARRRASLRQALYKLRGMGVRVGLDTEVVQLDATQVARTFSFDRSAEHFERDVTCGREPFGTFVAGYVAPSVAIEEWLATEREAVHAEVRRVLVAQLRLRRERADWSGAEALARWLLRFDPLHEDATLTLAECTMLAGAKVEAIAMLDRYLAEIGPGAGDVRLPASQMRRRFVEANRGRLSFAPTERHFVGREQDIADLTIAIRRARWREGSAVLYHAPSGIGKTRLTVEVGKLAAIEGARELRAACREGDAARELSLFLDVLPAVLALPGALGCQPESLATLKRLVPGPRPAGVPRDASRDETAAAPAAPPDETDVSADSLVHHPHFASEPLPMIGSIRTAIVDVLAAVSDERPLLLMVDDTHWIDSASWEVLADIIERVSNLRIVVLLTSREPHARAVRPERVPLALRMVSLAPLGEGSLFSLAQLICEDMSTSLTDDARSWLVNAAGGNPLFLRALLNHWIETGITDGVPPTLLDLVNQRLRRLSPDSVRMLQVIVLLGRQATIEVTQRVLEFSTVRSLDAYEELHSVGALSAADSGELLYAELLGRSAINALSQLSRRVLHSRIASSLTVDLSQQELPVAIATAIARIANMRQANMEHAMMESALQLAAQFLHWGAPIGTLAVCEATGPGTSFKTDRRRLRRLEVEALYLSGRYSQLISLVEESGEAFSIHARWDAIHPTDVLHFIESSSHAGSTADYEDICARALLIAESTSVPRDLRLDAALSVVRLSGHGVSARLPQRAFTIGKLLCSARSIATVARDRLDLCFHTAFGEMDSAIEAGKRLLASGLHDCSPDERLEIETDIAYTFRVSDNSSMARAMFEGVLVRGSELGLPNRAAVAAWYLSLMALDDDLGTSESRRWLDEALQIARDSAVEFLTLLCEQQAARLAIFEGDIDAASRLNAASKTRAVWVSHPKRTASALAHDLAVALATLQADRVSQLLPDATRWLSQLGGSLGQDYLASQIATAYEVQGRFTEGAAVMQRYSQIRRERTPMPKYLASRRSFSAS